MPGHTPATAGLPVIPVRLCCGERHLTAQCPGGLVMRCLCFLRVPVNGLHKTDDGYQNVCLSCAADEIYDEVYYTADQLPDQPHDRRNEK
jgi:hypothetical protein